METNPESQSEAGRGVRYHGFDKLRASMMLLVLVNRSALSYLPTQYGQLVGWPFLDRRTSAVFAALSVFVNTFCMPAIFVMAGFFGALLQRR